MEKLVYLMWGDASPVGAIGCATSSSDTALRLVDAGAHAVTVNVHDTSAAEAPSPVPTPEGEDPHVAEVSVWVDSYDRRAPVEQPDRRRRSWRRRLSRGGVALRGLRHHPHAGPRDWADGQRSPGVLTVSLIHRPEGLDYTTWIERWHGTQSPLSGELQPRCRYVRNEVVRPLTDGAPEIHGIVEEAWPSAQHVADPMLFFNAHGDPAVLSEHITAMLDSVNACLDLARIRNTTMSEYLVKTL